MRSIPSFFARQIRIKREIILVVTLWTAIMAFITIKIFWLKYTTTERLTAYNVIYTLYDAPAPELLDIIIIAAASLMIAFLISTPENLVYGFLASFFLALFVGVAYVFLFIWFIQGYGTIFSIDLYSWEVPFFYATLNVFRIMFPAVVATSLIGVFTGFLVKSLIRNQLKFT
jgi:hypothetical protein